MPSTRYQYAITLTQQDAQRLEAYARRLGISNYAVVKSLVLQGLDEAKCFDMIPKEVK